ncbi:hypothetical protein [Methanobacterium spitsbergense]|uniref:Uncharacterized protein n=1 Tax=Methanobacterium spitsbergense TaxID=2874285 RepID=A0A8T5UYX8_9EURY|nr:hypothetical protein [Methanobacterium spitsbergense]MBZ2166370.1 hypothetical protein [Methanobacterium spitsbergense]
MPVKTLNHIEYQAEGHYTSHSLDDIAELLGKHQIMKVYPKRFEQVESKVRDYPLLHASKGRVSNGSRVYLVTPKGCYEAWIGRG